MRRAVQFVSVATVLLCSAAPLCLGQETGTLYFYRYKQHGDSALRPSVYCDEVQLARIKGGSYYVAHLAPGEHTCRAEVKSIVVKLTVSTGEDYYLRVEFREGPFIKDLAYLVQTRKEQGAFEIKKLKPMTIEAAPTTKP